MIKPRIFFEHLKKEGVDFFTGVPDSLLKDLCFYISDHSKKNNHIIAANEGSALSISIGYHLSTNKVPVIYLQNSGLGNLINPLLSLADKDVYSIPMLLVIGWRGKPGLKDEPQHKKTGRVMLDMLKAMKISYKIINKLNKPEKIKDIVTDSINRARKSNSPVVLIVEKETFEKYSLKKINKSSYPLVREEAIQVVMSHIGDKDIIISTTGFTSRELYEYRKNNNQDHSRDFLTVGGMGHANQIALGVALQENKKSVYCFDGDGSMIMHMGSLTTNGALKCNNLKHIVFNNGSHESVGGQPTTAHQFNMKNIAKNMGYDYVLTVKNKKELEAAILKINKYKGTSFLEIMISNGTRSDLGRPKSTPLENKKSLMGFLKK
jgi:phosphonopyruvate decarboxylase